MGYCVELIRRLGWKSLSVLSYPIKVFKSSSLGFKYVMKVKEESEKVGLKLNIQKMKIMASSPITS